MKILKDLAEAGVKYLRPDRAVMRVPNTLNARAFVLGPPRDPDLLEDLDPKRSEEFHTAVSSASPDGYFATAARAASAGERSEAPFARRYAVEWPAASQAVFGDDDHPFFSRRYGSGNETPSNDGSASDNAPWRRIDRDWLYSAEQFALDMNNATNNSSLVLAFELGRGGKVLLFAADAQRGNWISWSKQIWKDGDASVTARDLFRRTVVYKVGHHGSHNATLNGRSTDDYPNLSWMAEGDHAREFVAMITAVRAWAETQKGWDHPLKAIKDALTRKASGRVFQTDTSVPTMSMPTEGSAIDWSSFQKRTRDNRLYFDYEVPG